MNRSSSFFPKAEMQSGQPSLVNLFCRRNKRNIDTGQSTHLTTTTVVYSHVILDDVFPVDSLHEEARFSF